MVAHEVYVVGECNAKWDHVDMIAYLYRCEQQGQYQWKPLDMPCWIREGIDMLKYVIATKQAEQSEHAARVSAAKARMQ